VDKQTRMFARQSQSFDWNLMTPVSPSLHTCLYSGARLRLQDLAGPLENAEELSRNFRKGKKQGGHVDIYIYIYIYI